MRQAGTCRHPAAAPVAAGRAWPAAIPSPLARLEAWVGWFHQTAHPQEQGTKHCPAGYRGVSPPGVQTLQQFCCAEHLCLSTGGASLAALGRAEEEAVRRREEAGQGKSEAKGGRKAECKSVAPADHLPQMVSSVTVPFDVLLVVCPSDRALPAPWVPEAVLLCSAAGSIKLLVRKPHCFHTCTPSMPQASRPKFTRAEDGIEGSHSAMLLLLPQPLLQGLSLGFIQVTQVLSLLSLHTAHSWCDRWGPAGCPQWNAVTAAPLQEPWKGAGEDNLAVPGQPGAPE